MLLGAALPLLLRAAGADPGHAGPAIQARNRPKNGGLAIAQRFRSVPGSDGYRRRVPRLRGWPATVDGVALPLKHKAVVAYHVRKVQDLFPKNDLILFRLLRFLLPSCRRSRWRGFFLVSHLTCK